MDGVAAPEHHDVPWMMRDVSPTPNQQLLRYIGSASANSVTPQGPGFLVLASELPHGSDFP